MTSRRHYAMHISWSDVDGAFLVTLPEWQDRVFGPVTHGASYEEAVRNGEDALALLIEAALEAGEALPEPQLYAATVR